MRLVVFDLDGTLLDSRALILAAMERAFGAVGRAAPPEAETLGIVGLSLPEAFARLVPQAPEAVPGLVAAYRAAFRAIREAGGGEAEAPLFPGARAALDRLGAEPRTLLGIATGKARPGLDHALGAHGIAGHFATLQTADRHPSKPDPAMLEACLVETGAERGRAVMIGDTDFDIAMGRAAGFRTVAVAWGNHPEDRLRAAGPDRVIGHFDELLPVLDALAGPV